MNSNGSRQFKPQLRWTRQLANIAPAMLLVFAGAAADAAEPELADHARRFETDIQPLVAKFCVDCHSGDTAEAEIDLARFATLADVQRNLNLWQKVRTIVDSGQMPPKDADQPSDAELAQLKDWLRGYLAAEAKRHAGDPGPVVLRRLNNAQYTFTIRDITGVDSLDPVREFPVDGAAGEGFTNTGNALAMSPGLVTKYLDAAKQIAGHMVLLPDGIRFSPATTRRDWTDEAVARLRRFYDQFSVAAGSSVDLHSDRVEANKGGRIPVEAYLKTLLESRTALARNETSLAEVANKFGLSTKYLGILQEALSTADKETDAGPVAQLRRQWAAAQPQDAARLAAELETWQPALWKYNQIGHSTPHLGGKTGPDTWMEALTPLASRQDFRIKLDAPPEQQEITLYLTATDAGDGNADDIVVWEQPRLVTPGRADLPLRDVKAAIAALATFRQQLAESAQRCLSAAAEADADSGDVNIAALAQKHQVKPDMLQAWLECLGIRAGQTRIDSHLKQQQTRTPDYDFIQGWVGPDALSVVANPTDNHVRIPGNMPGHSVAAHPAPNTRVVVGWRSPSTQTVQVSGKVQHAHPECGNGIQWILELRRGATRQQLATGTSAGANVMEFGPIDGLALRAGDVVSLAISPRDGNHSCDLTTLDLIVNGAQSWNLARDVAPNILAGNPHADSFGNLDVWHFFTEPDHAPQGNVIPAGSLLAQWQASGSTQQRAELARQIQCLLSNGPIGRADESPDTVLYRQLLSLRGPLASAARAAIEKASGTSNASDSVFGIDASAFGTLPSGEQIDAHSLAMQAPRTLEIKLPAELVRGSEFVTSGVLHGSGGQGSVQLQVTTVPVHLPSLSPATKVIVQRGSSAERQFVAAFEEMRRLFPASLCYSAIVPIDEAVTLNLFFREDHELRRLMLDDSQSAELDRLWDELKFVAQEPLGFQTAYEQISEFATQDRPDMVEKLAPIRPAVDKQAEQFRARLVACEPRQLEGLVEFAAKAYRRPLTTDEQAQLRAFYADLRAQKIDHEEALRLTLARILVSPAFLYRIEKPGPDEKQQPVSSIELASRLSYFLWSSAPDAELLETGLDGRLLNDQELLAQTRRMLKDAKTRRLASEFAAQWLHIYNFDQHDEKSETHFPEFAGLRGAMYEESLQFFTDLFQNNGSVLIILDADHTFLNDALAKHYEIDGVEGAHWRRVDGVREKSRGGILTQASILATQAGASRTSPILRGNWLSEVVLGERLPRPPKDVPVLADTPPEGLTERQLIEKHSSDPACAKCHLKIDPLGFALENFDAIGRFRSRDVAGLDIDAKTVMPDGTRLDGYTGLQKYLLEQRRDDFVRQFNKKLLGFALGRSVLLSDEPLLDEMHEALKQRNYQVHAAIDVLVLSRQFRDIRGRDFPVDETTP